MRAPSSGRTPSPIVPRIGRPPRVNSDTATSQTPSLVLLIRDDDPLRFERAAVRWLSRYTAGDRGLRLSEARELVEMLDGVGRHDQVARLRLERFLRAAAMRLRPTGWRRQTPPASPGRRII
jgi:hypothetical protein